MGQAEAGGIMEALKGLLHYKITQQKLEHDRNLEQQRLDIEKQRREDEKKQRQDELKQRQQEHKDLTEYQKLQLKAADAVHSVQRKEAEQKMGQAYQEGAPLPGDAQMGRLQGGMSQPKLEGPLSNIAPAPGMDNRNPTQSISIPMGQDQAPLMFQATPPDIYAQKAADRQAVLNKPKQDFELKKIDVQQKAETARQETIEKIRQDAETARNTATNAMHLTTTSINAAAHRYSAELAAGGLSVDPESARTDVQNFLNGTYTLDDLSKLYPHKGTKKAIKDAVTGADGVILTGPQKKFLVDLAPANRAIPLMEEFQDVLKKADPSDLINPRSQVYQRLEGLKSKIKEDLINAAGQFKTAGRLTKQIVDQAHAAYAPGSNVINRGATLERNSRNHLEFKKLLGQTVKSHLAGMSDGQVALVMANHGFDPAIYGDSKKTPDKETTSLTVKGKTYNIPNDRVEEFKKDHPDAR